jgi:hypothetical protein
MKNEKDKKVDWRVGVCVKVKDFDKNAFPNWNVGDDLVTCSSIQNGKDKLTFYLPNSTALMLNISKDNYNSAMSLKTNALNKIYKNTIKEEYLYEYFEKIMISIISGYTSLESFANDEIPENYIHYKKVKKLFLPFKKVDAERKLNLDIKLNEILPEVYKIKKLSGLKIWDDYNELKEIRDRIVHLKSLDRHSLYPKMDSIWDYLIKNDIKKPYEIAFKIIEYFYTVKDINTLPWWYKNNKLFNT